MRCYFQGTLDYACGIYAVINALSCTHGLDLAGARRILQDLFETLPENPALWRAFVRNETDHYWLIRQGLSRWCLGPRWKYRAEQPFSDCLMPEQDWAGLEGVSAYLPEQEAPRGPASTETAGNEARAVWAVLQSWFESPLAKDDRQRRVAILRFHRFLPGMAQPVISHWTTVSGIQGNVLMLQDASSERHAIRSISKVDCISASFSLSMIRIVPESVILLERPGMCEILHPV